MARPAYSPCLKDPGLFLSAPAPRQPVTDVSAMLVATMQRRTPSGAGAKTRACGNGRGTGAASGGARRKSSWTALPAGREQLSSGRHRLQVCAPCAPCKPSLGARLWRCPALRPCLHLWRQRSVDREHQEVAAGVGGHGAHWRGGEGADALECAHGRILIPCRPPAAVLHHRSPSHLHRPAARPAFTPRNNAHRHRSAA